MYGAILGDMIGAPYEFEKKQKKSKDFDMFNRRIHFTDDTVMSVAIAEAIMTAETDADEQTMKAAFISHMQKWGRKYRQPVSAECSQSGSSTRILSPTVVTATDLQ